MRPQGVPSVGQTDRDLHPSASLELVIRGGWIRQVPPSRSPCRTGHARASRNSRSRLRFELGSPIVSIRRCASSCWPAQREMRSGPKTSAGRGEFSKPKDSMPELQCHRFAFKCAQPHWLAAPTPTASHFFKHTMTAHTTFGTAAVIGQMPCRDVIPVAANQRTTT